MKCVRFFSKKKGFLKKNFLVDAATSTNHPALRAGWFVALPSLPPPPPPPPPPGASRRVGVALSTSRLLLPQTPGAKRRWFVGPHSNTYFRLASATMSSTVVTILITLQLKFNVKSTMICNFAKYSSKCFSPSCFHKFPG